MSTNSQVQPIQVTPLGLNGSGRNTEMGKALSKQNEELTMHIAQSATDTQYDPTMPSRTTTSQFVHEGFCNHSKSLIYTFGVCGILFIVYGLVVDGRKHR